VGLRLYYPVDRLGGIPCLTANDEIILPIDEICEPLANKRMIIDHKNATFACDRPGRARIHQMQAKIIATQYTLRGMLQSSLSRHFSEYRTFRRSMPRHDASSEAQFLRIAAWQEIQLHHQ
jgi:hypothetical protein